MSALSALNALLQNPDAILEELHTWVYRNDLSTIKDSLARNKTVKRLPGARLDAGLLNSLLCDSSSIQSIYNSNHTIEEVEKYTDHDEEELAMAVRCCLELNKNPNKEQVIRNKILRYYFAGAFDLSPFVTMPVSVLPKVMSEIGGDEINRQSAIFRLLKGLPELCNMSGRASGASEVSSTAPRKI